MVTYIALWIIRPSVVVATRYAWDQCQRRNRSPLRLGQEPNAIIHTQSAMKSELIGNESPMLILVLIFIRISQAQTWNDLRLLRLRHNIYTSSHIPMISVNARIMFATINLWVFFTYRLHNNCTLKLNLEHSSWRRFPHQVVRSYLKKSHQKFIQSSTQSVRSPNCTSKSSKNEMPFPSVQAIQL